MAKEDTRETLKILCSFRERESTDEARCGKPNKQEKNLGFVLIDFEEGFFSLFNFVLPK